MSLFKKSPDEKAAKQQRKKTLERRQEEINAHLGRLEKAIGGIAIAVNSVAEVLYDDEKVITATTGKCEGKYACLACTDQRIVVAYGVLTGRIELPYDDIDRVDTGRKFSGSWISLHNSLQQTKIEKSQASDERMHEIKDTIRAQQAASPASPGAVSDTSQIARLSELHESGALTDEEFSAAKAKILGL